MKLVANLPDPEEFRLDLETLPRVARPGRTTHLRLALHHPKTGEVVRDFELLHERLFHLFVISDDLSFFAHDHPTQNPDGSFLLPIVLPKPAAYRVVADTYPKNATPQFLAKTIITPGARFATPKLPPSLGPQSGLNLTVELETEPKQPIAGQETLLFFRLKPADGLQQYLAAWGHMLVASQDLIDVVHDHPLYVDGVSPPDLKKQWPSQIQFNIIFPRETTYRVWVQFQRERVVNTVAFNIPVKALR